MQEKDKNRVSPAETAWALFEKTGRVSYYLLYKDLTK
jgi:hypothetical protein